jgi:hypothetical protein
MKISKTHQRLSNYLNNPEVLTNPEPFLGPNWETVLRWWLYAESLTDVQRKELARRYFAIDDDTRNRAWKLAHDAAIEVIGKDNWRVAHLVSRYTAELIALHKLKEKGIQPTFLPLLEDFEHEPPHQYVIWQHQMEELVQPVTNIYLAIFFALFLLIVVSFALLFVS